MDKSIHDLYVTHEEISRNRTKRILLCFCVDASASMAVSGMMDKVNQGIESFFRRTRSEILARDAADICIVTFGDRVEVVCDFGSFDAACERVLREPLRATGALTKLAAGVNCALDRLEEHQRQLAEVGNNAYLPWLIILSDGVSTEPEAELRKASERVFELLRANKLRTRCLSMDDGYKSLRHFTVGEVDRLEELSVIDFFDLVSRSVSLASKQAIERPAFELEGGEAAKESER